MSNFILSSESEIVNMIFQDKWNQVMETMPSHSAYHSNFFTILFNRKLLIECPKEALQNQFKNICVFFDKSNCVDLICTLTFTIFFFLYPLHFVIHQTFYDTFLKSMMDWDVKGLSTFMSCCAMHPK